MRGRYILRLLAFASVLVTSATSWAKIGTLDDVPGATLLFPYFEVDTQNDQGVTTLISIQNASATAILANITLWTDRGLPTVNFPIYLTGYDQETIDLRNVFERVLPTTASAGQDPTDTVSPHGRFSQDINFASCGGTIPGIATNGAWVGSNLVAAHTGQASTDHFGGLCGASAYGDGIARGYVTADTISQCTSEDPSNPTYFSSFIGTFQNVMLGEWEMHNPTAGRIVSERAVAIEASPTDPLTSTDMVNTKPTFYGRFSGHHATDNREPLPTAWGAFDSQGNTDLIYWRDPATVVAPFACNTSPAPFPMSQKSVTAFDSSGNTVPVPGGNHFPLAAAATPDSALGSTSSFGWLFLNLNLAAPSGPLGDIRQSWVSVSQRPRGVASNSPLRYVEPAVQLGTPGNNPNPAIP